MYKKELLTAVACAVITVFATSCTRQEQSVKHVVLISVDGSRPEFYMDSAWPAPNLQRLKEEGVYAISGAQSVFPSVTLPSHTTLITGAYPARHGIYYNKPFNAKNKHAYRYDSSIKVKTLWEAVEGAGMTSAAIRWPVSVGAPVDYNFPKKMKVRKEGKKITYPYTIPDSLIAEFENSTGKKLTAKDFSHKNNAIQKTLGELSNYIISTYKPNLIAIHLGVDHMEHVYGRNAPQVKQALFVVDSVIGTILQTIDRAGIKNSTAVIITGDHGHANTKAYFKPNVYLARHGLITREGLPAGQAGWKAKFRGSGGSAFLYVKNREQAVLDTVKDILSQIPTPQRQLFRIIDREELDTMGANPDVALALAMKEGYLAKNGSEGMPLVKHDTGSAHGYDPALPDMHTMFIAAGAGIKEHVPIKEIGIKDVAPLIANLLGLQLKSPDGVLMPGILKEE